MAIVLYKKGTSAVENGIVCDLIRVEPKALKNHLAIGWKLTPEEIEQDDVLNPVIAKDERHFHKESEKQKKAKKFTTEPEKGSVANPWGNEIPKG